jgi:DNA polymerase I
MEFGLSAVVTDSATMKAFYQTADPYLATAIAAAAVPPHANKNTHPEARSRYKTGVLACLYGIAARSLGKRLREPIGRARQFLQMHHEIFADYWRVSDGLIAEAVRGGSYTSRHGWHYAVVPPINERSLRNWPIQTLGADVLRAAVIFADAIGIEMVATAHDAVLIEAPEDQIEAKVAEMAYCMKLASAVLCDGFTLEVDWDIRRHGERFIEDRGKRTFAVAERFVTNGAVVNAA